MEVEKLVTFSNPEIQLLIPALEYYIKALDSREQDTLPMPNYTKARYDTSTPFREIKSYSERLFIKLKACLDV